MNAAERQRLIAWGFNPRSEATNQCALKGRGLSRYVMGVVDDISVDEMQGMMDEALPETEEEVIMTLAEQLRREGFEKGEKIGEKKGATKGFRQGIIDAIELGLTLRFGDKALELMPKVRRMRKIEKLQALKEAIKTANDLSDFKGRM